MPKDRERRILIRGRLGMPTVATALKLDIPGGPPVRVVYRGYLERAEKELIRQNIATARDKVNLTIAALSQHPATFDDATREKLREGYGVGTGANAQAMLGQLRRGLESLADGLYSPKSRIEIHEKLYAGDRAGTKIQRAPHREVAVRAESGQYSDANPRVRVEMARGAATGIDGSRHILGSFALACASTPPDRAEGYAALADHLGDHLMRVREATRQTEKDRASSEDRLKATSDDRIMHNQSEKPGKSAASLSSEKPLVASQTPEPSPPYSSHDGGHENGTSPHGKENPSGRSVVDDFKPMKEAPLRALGAQDRTLIEQQVGEFRNKQQEYSADDHKAIVKALTDGLRSSEHAAVMRGLKPRGRASEGRGG